jgi:hypothetical protein
MPDIATLTAFLTSLKSATDIVKVIREAGFSFEKAEGKLKLAALMESLADARIHAVEIQQVIQEKDDRIAELKNALELKAKLARKDDAYYELNEDGNPSGAPYCSHCWEVNHRAIHLNLNFPPITRSCPACKTKYDANHVGEI